jgi:hypothetical protein
LYVLVVLLLISISGKYENYVRNDVLKFEELSSITGVVSSIATGRFRHITIKDETYGVSQGEVDKSFLKGKKVQVWYQEKKRLFGSKKIIYQIKAGNWMMRTNYNVYYLEELAKSKNFIYIFTFYTLGIVAIFLFIGIRLRKK